MEIFYKPAIGLEIHAELKTKTKMFCNCLNDSDEKHPNINICSICLGHPGTLPVINKKAVKLVVMVGLALNSRINQFSKFDRKNYFYPDLPKGYQISQYDLPLCVGGFLEIPANGKKIKIARIHLEEDAGRLIHSFKNSLVDFNRAGLPLLELVTEPDMESALEAVSFAKELQLMFQYLGASSANMENGEMRLEANISLSPNAALGTKVEVKNLNSFESLGLAIEYEIKRQKNILKSGQKVIQETRGFDANKKMTFFQRKKEASHDYRYFPEPDLPILDLKELNLDKLKLEIPELPNQKRERFREEFKLKNSDIEIIINDPVLASYFENSVSEFLEIDKDNIKNIQLLVNYLNNDFLNCIREMGAIISEIRLTPKNFAELINLSAKDKISSRVTKDLLKEIVKTGGNPSQIVEERGLFQLDDRKEVEELVKKIILKNEKIVLAYRSGKVQVIENLIGQVIKLTGGKANPKIIKEIVLKQLI